MPRIISFNPDYSLDEVQRSSVFAQVHTEPDLTDARCQFPKWTFLSFFFINIYYLRSPYYIQDGMPILRSARKSRPPSFLRSALIQQVNLLFGLNSTKSVFFPDSQRCLMGLGPRDPPGILNLLLASLPLLYAVTL